MIVGNGGGPFRQHNEHIINELFHFHTSVVSTLASSSPVGAISIILNDTAGFLVGDYVQINNSNIETTFPVITDLPGGNVIMLDRPLDFAYDIDDLVEVIHVDLSLLVGTLVAPIVHRLTPVANEIWMINRVIVTMTHSAAASDDKFGGLAALSNGVIFRANNNGQFRSFGNWKTNGDMILDAYDVTYSDKAGPSLFGTSARETFTRFGTVVRLDGTKGDYMDILIQDDITALNSFFINGQGYSEAA